MQWFVDNWSLLVVLLAIGVIAFNWYKKFTKLPSDEQLLKVKEFLLVCVIEAEKDLGGGVGSLKLSRVYKDFVLAFPSLVSIIPFKVFSDLVDEVLEQMRHLLETNEKLSAYVKGEES